MAHDTLILALAKGIYEMHHEIRPQKASSSDPPTTGSDGDQMSYRSKIASPLVSPDPATARLPAADSVEPH
jgi:hypothetical protein